MNDTELGCGSLIIVTMAIFIIFGLMGMIHLPNNGSHVGYVTAVDQGAICTKVYFKTSLDSSQEDVYEIPRDSEQIKELREALRNKENVEITYRANNWSWCGRDIIEVEEVKLKNK
jgi:hypothetical protein